MSQLAAHAQGPARHAASNINAVHHASHAPVGIGQDPYTLYDDMLRLVRGEQEQLGQLIQHPF